MPRRLPIGTEVATAERGAHIRVWAPTHAKVTAVVESFGEAGGVGDGRDYPREVVLGREPGGYHGGFVPGLAVGGRYRFKLGDSRDLVPDPASRYQPDGPMGPSQVVDPAAFAWTDAGWRGIAADRHVMYELHVGTFTQAGTWAAAAEWLPYLRDVGITTIEMMPVAEFAGRYNWGYDGVNWFAPTRAYGTPDDLRRFIDQAHAAGVAVILDVVYNHLGPSGNTLYSWSPYYQAQQTNEWGAGLNYDGENSGPVRELVIANAGYWIDEFHFDGLRLDATQAILDRSDDHVVAALTRRARDAGRGRHIFVVGENEPEDPALLGPKIGLDAMWNDDFHHSARVAATGLVDGYLHDYRGTPQELISALKRAFLYQGQIYPWQHNPRGGSTRGLGRNRFVHFLENHDQVANVGFGERLCRLCDPATIRALTAVLLLSPALPLLFQGQECCSHEPWQFFVDHEGDLAGAVRTGRAKFMAQFARLATPEAQAMLTGKFDPCAEATFQACVLDPSARRLDNPHVMLHRDLLQLRKEPAFADPRQEAVDGEVLTDRAFVMRFLQDDPNDDRLLLVNLGSTVNQQVLPQPLLAPPDGTAWKLVWSSEDVRYGGHGTPEPIDRKRLLIPARSALVLAPEPGTLRVATPGPEGDQSGSGVS